MSTCSNHSELRFKRGILRSTDVCLPTRSGSGREIEFSRICAKVIAELRDLFLASKPRRCVLWIPLEFRERRVPEHFNVKHSSIGTLGVRRGTWYLCQSGPVAIARARALKTTREKKRTMQCVCLCVYMNVTVNVKV